MKTFKELNEKHPDTLMIVDALNLAFRYAHKKSTSFMDDYLRTVDSLAKSYKAGKVIIACDEGSSTYRKNIFPDYKKGRKEKYAAQTDEERLYFEQFFQEFTRIIDMYKEVDDYPIIKFPGCEADDIGAYIVNRRRKKNKIWLMSSDKDWDLLVGPNVSRFSYVTRKEITEENWHEHYDYPVDAHISIKCLTGDSGDSIPGVEGIGPVKARTLVESYGSTYDIISSMPLSSKYKYVANLNEFGADNLLRNYKLMDLITHCDEALGEENCKTIDNILEKYLDGN